MTKSRPKPTTPHGEQAASPRPFAWRMAAPVAGAAAAVQAVVWILMWEAFGVARLGYWFFDLSDIPSVYYPYALNLAGGMAAYRDFFIEYPPLFVPLLVAAGNPADETGFVFRFSAMMVGFMILAGVVTALAAIDERQPWRAYATAGAFALFSLLLGPITANRYDAVVALLIALSLLLMIRRDWELAGLVIGVGFALKITPVLVLPIVALLAPVKRSVRALVVFAIAAAVPFLWVLALGGSAPSVLGQMLSYQISRPLEIESLLATPLWIGQLIGATHLTVGLAAGSQVLQSPVANALAGLSAVALLAGLGVTLWLVWRRRREVLADPRLIALAVLVTMLASLVGSKVLSPQYFVWIVPPLALVALDRRLLGAVVGVALLLTHVLFPANYWAVAVDLQPGPITVVIVRNLLVLAAFAIGVWELWRVPAQTVRRR